MTNNNKLLILERSGSTLSFKQEESGAYVLEGCFGEIDKLNRNNRIYTESEYLPQIESLQAKIKSSKLLGELDHPQTFDISLKNVSHIIEELSYNKDTKQIMGKIRLLDTDAGKQAKALVDAGVPLHISSRAAGTVESNGQVKIKQLFTYDLVADPGFANAELKRVNEALGFDDDNIFIYEINNIENNQTQTTENKMEQSRFVSTEDFNKYSKYLATEIKGLKESLTEKNNDTFAKEVESLKEYSSYLAEKMNSVIEYNNYMAEKLDQTIEHGDHIAEKVDQSIQYSEKIAESVNKVKEYSNYLAEAFNDGAATHENMLKYVTYLKENLEKVTEYAEYIAENVNKNLIVEADTDAGLPAEDIKAKADDKTPLVKDADGKVYPHGGEAEDDAKKLEDELAEEPKGDDVGKEVTEEVDRMDAYKKEISEKLQALVEKATVKVSNNPHFFAFISEAKKEEFNSLTDAEKANVIAKVEGKGFLTEAQIYALWNNVIAGAPVENEPTVLAAMPSEYRETWNRLSEAKKNQILAQAKYHKLDTEYQVRNFWQQRDLRETSTVMEKVEMVSEKVVEKVSTLPYNMDGMAESFAKRFKK
jgi:hypothetical protein